MIQLVNLSISMVEVLQVGTKNTAGSVRNEGVKLLNLANPSKLHFFDTRECEVQGIHIGVVPFPFTYITS